VATQDGSDGRVSGLWQDPEWHRASAWLDGEHFAEAAGRISILGAPLRLGSITPGRSDLAPAAIREALDRLSSFDVESELDLRRLAARDAGDLVVAEHTPEEAFSPIQEQVMALLSESQAVVLLGGDNSITRPGVHSLNVPLQRVGLLTIDAHFDLRNTANGLTNGNPVRALLEDGLPGRNIVQIGIQPFANSDAAVEIAHQVGSRFVTIGQVRRRGIETVLTEALADLDGRVDAIYVDLDLDVLDRAFAPATPGSRPGGLTNADLMHAARCCGLHPKVRVIDLVELDPTHDVSGLTSLSAAAALLHFAAGLLARCTQSV
jgi:formiminoglutamase